jgi:hypothetical protein
MEVLIKMIKRLSLVILLCLFLCISLVSAETLTGSLGSSGVVSTNYILGYDVGGQYDNIYYDGSNCLSTKAIEYNTGSTALIHFDDTGHPSSYASTANISGICPVTGKIGAATIFTGYFGYFRSFNFIGTEIEGYQYYTFSNWNSSGLTGAQDIKIYNNGSCGLLGVQSRRTNNHTQFISGLLTLGQSSFNGFPGGYYTYNKNIDFFNEYTVTKPSGIGITGYVTKTIGGTAYSSKVHILNGTSDTQLQSDQYANTNQFNISTNAESIKINIYSSGQNWYNSSVLFAPVTPTITPTPTIPVGYTRTYAYTSDCISGARLQNTNISFYDIENTSWTNYTYDTDGKGYIDALASHTLDIYGSDPSGVFGTDAYLNQPVGSDGKTFSLLLCPSFLDPGEGNTNLVLSTYDAATNYILQSVTVQAQLPTGSIEGGNTGLSGSYTFVVPNNTNIVLTGVKTGYITTALTVNSGSGQLKLVKMYLGRYEPTTQIPTQTPFPSPTITPYPTQTLQGNLTTCKANMPLGSTVTDIMFNNIACWGITDLEGQNLTFAALIILICALILGKIGKGDGAIIGGIIGFIISFARHLIPFYLLVLAFIFIGAYFARKLMGDK